jgi:dUTP pyrophosphatase
MLAEAVAKQNSKQNSKPRRLKTPAGVCYPPTRKQRGDDGMILKIRRLNSLAVAPAYAHPGDAGMDLCAAESTAIAPGAAALVHTGLAIELPPGTEAQVRPRSGLALKHGVTVLNSPGTIDEGYRGEVGVILVNHGAETFRVEPGMKIAQMVVQPVLRVAVHEAEELSETRRGAGGFGSTGLRAREGGA